MAGETILLHTFYRQTGAILTFLPHAKYYQVTEVTQVAIKKNKIEAKKNSHSRRNIKKSIDAHARFDDHRKLEKNVNKIRLYQTVPLKAGRPNVDIHAQQIKADHHIKHMQPQHKSSSPHKTSR